MRPGQGAWLVSSTVFMGHGASALDGKGRFALPIAFRSVLDKHCSEPGQMMIRADSDRKYVSLFGGRQVEYFQAKFDEKSRIAMERGEDFDEEEADGDFWGSIQPASIDSGGRFTLPPAYRRIYGISDGIFMIGAGRLVQLWDPARYLAENKKNLVAIESCEAFLEDLRIKREGKA